LLQSDPRTAPAEASGSGRPTLGDALLRITDDPEALLAELAAMPAAPSFAGEVDQPLCDDELLGTCLHVLAHGRDGAIATEGTVRLADHLMAKPTPRQRRILGAYLRLSRDGRLAGRPDAQARLAAFVQLNGVQHLMTARETLDVE